MDSVKPEEVAAAATAAPTAPVSSPPIPDGMFSSCLVFLFGCWRN